MNIYHIEDVFGTKARIACLRVLSRVAVPLSIRQVAAQARISHVAAADALDALVRLGAVGASVTGRSRIHWLERRNLVVTDLVLPAFAAEETSYARLVAELAVFIPQLVSLAILFGSYARGDQTTESDIDLLVVGGSARDVRDSLDALDAAGAEMRARLGASVSVLGYTMEQARTLIAQGDNFMSGAIRDGHVVAGVVPTEWGITDEGD